MELPSTKLLRPCIVSGTVKNGQVKVDRIVEEVTGKVIWKRLADQD